MNKLLKFSSIALCAFLTLGAASCSNNDEPDTPEQVLSEGDQLLQKALKVNVENTINETYKDLADSTSLLYDQMLLLRKASAQNAVTQEMVDKACKLFLGARANYELSEAFLLGAAADFSIDPHIDSWPLDLNRLFNLLASPNLVNSLDGEDGPQAANENLGQSLLGFHGIEFILFRDGQPRKAAELNANGKDSYNKDGLNFTNFSGEYELIYATAVCGDLRNSVYRLECSWNADAPEAHKKVMEDLEWAITTSTSGISYGENMVNAGKAGSTYRSVKNAISAILIGDGGAAGISDEVGNVKINNPFSGADVNYIESPYSHNSLTDFTHNIQSIENVWKGGRKENRNSQYSLEAYFKKYNPEINTRVETAITTAIAEINKIPAPFVLNYTNPQCQKAIDACLEVSNALNAADSFIQNTDK